VKHALALTNAAAHALSLWRSCDDRKLPDAGLRAAIRALRDECVETSKDARPLLKRGDKHGGKAK